MSTSARVSESRAESAARELLTLRGWNVLHPPRGHVLWKNEYRDYPHLLEALRQASKSGSEYGLPDFMVISPQTSAPLIVGEVKARSTDIDQAVSEAAEIYGEAFALYGANVLAAGIAGDGDPNVAVRVSKRGPTGWRPIEYREGPIEWLPTPDEVDTLLRDETLFRLDPRVPPAEVLASSADEINRILRESKIKDEYRPAVIGAFMLALWQTRGDIRTSSEYVLTDINVACQRAFSDAAKYEISESIVVPEANERLASQAARIVRILRLLNITTLTAAHDYLGQLYETFFRFTGGNTIGQFFTPRHITTFMADLCEITEHDRVVDPTCGTGGFLISALQRMIGDRQLTHDEIGKMVAGHLTGFESEPITAALCVANMILRGDGTTGVVKGDCFIDDRFPEAEATVVLGNPPFPHKNTDDPTEKYINRALDALQIRGELAMIVPGSLLVKGGKFRLWREATLKFGSLKAVITLPTELFAPYASATTAIIILQKGVPHDRERPVFFAHIENDGYKLRKGTRVEQAGEQLTDILTAYRDHKEEPGRCAWRPAATTEWAPGAYISSGPSDDESLKETITFLFRSSLGFQMLHAEELARLRSAVTSGEVEPTTYAPKGRRPPLTLDQPDTIGHHFNIYYCQKALHSKEHLEPGVSLVISSSGTDNGCYGFFDFADLLSPPFVTVPSTGSIGESAVQEFPCGVTDDCLVLIPKDDTRLEDLFIAAATIRHEKWRFNYGRKITPSRIEHLVLNRSVHLKEAIHQGYRDILIAASSVLSTHDEAILRSEIAELCGSWERGRPHGVDMAEMVMHLAYQRIIGKGPNAVPLLLAELERKPGHWFWALHVITGADPVPPESQGRLAEMAAAWIEWGKKQGYRW